MAFLNTVRNRAVEPWFPNPKQSTNTGWYDPAKNTANPYLASNTRYGTNPAGSYTGFGGNSFLGTFLKLAKQAIPYTTDVIKKRRQDKIDQWLQYQKDLTSQKTGQNVSGGMTGLDEYGRTPEQAAWDLRGKASIRRGIASGSGSDTSRTAQEASKHYKQGLTPPTPTNGKTFQEARDEAIAASYSNALNTPGGIQPEVAATMTASQRSNQPTTYNLATSQPETIDGTDQTIPGQGNPLLNIDENGDWEEPTDEQYDEILRKKKKDSEGNGSGGDGGGE